MDDRKRNLRRRYKPLYDEVVRILYRHDPIGIGIKMDGPANEYEPEAGSILPRLRDVSTIENLSVILREEFIHWFDENLAGPVENYLPIAREILAAKQREWEETDNDPQISDRD